MSIARRIKSAANPEKPKPEPVMSGKPTPSTSEKRGRGRPPSGKERVTIRLDADVLASYRSLGKGWQRVINDDLRKARGI